MLLFALTVTLLVAAAAFRYRLVRLGLFACGLGDQRRHRRFHDATGYRLWDFGPLPPLGKIDHLLVDRILNTIYFDRVRRNRRPLSWKNWLAADAPTAQVSYPTRDLYGSRAFHREWLRQRGRFMRNGTSGI